MADETGTLRPRPSPCEGCVVSLTYSTAEAAEQLGAPSERWLIEQVRSGKFKARKIGRHWRMTDQDIQEALDSCKNRHPKQPPAVSAASGLTPRSRRRLVDR
jgi:excisionase family DNA binding protein